MDENLVAAAQYMDEHGWTRKQLKSYDGQVCLIGALASVMKDIRGNIFVLIESETYDRLSRYLGADPRFLPRQITYFNDYVIQTKEEAVKVLMGAAEYE